MVHRRTASFLLALLATACGDAASTNARPVALQYQLEGMHCDGCVQAITDKVTHLDGVTACRVSLQDRRADIEVRDAMMAASVRKAIETLGYKVTPVEAGAQATQPKR